MAGRSEKKQAKEKSSVMNIIMISILIVSAVSYLLMIVFNLDQLSSVIAPSLYFAISNYGLYYLLDSFYTSMFFNYILDLLIINLVVMLGVNFHYKFWFLFLAVPGYFIYQLGVMAYNHVKSLDQDKGEEDETPKGKDKKRPIKKVIRE